MQITNVSRLRFRVMSTFVAVLLAGCGTSDTTPGATSPVPSTDVTKAMVGHWGLDGEMVLIISLDDDQIDLSAPTNDMWRADILDATIIDDSIHFVQKNYLRSGEPHPFNGVACISIVTLVSEDELELVMTTKDAPDLEPDILTRME